MQLKILKLTPEESSFVEELVCESRKLLADKAAEARTVEGYDYLTLAISICDNILEKVWVDKDGNNK